MQTIEYQLEKLNDQLTKLETMSVPSFSETRDFSEHKEFSEGNMSGFKDLAIMAGGGAIAPIASSLINRFVPIGTLGAVLVGFGLKVIVKNPTVSKLADGMIIASLSQFISNLMAGKIGFSEGNDDERESFSENRIGAVNFG